MSNQPLYVFAQQIDASSNNLVILHDNVKTHTGITIGNGNHSNVSLSYTDVCGAVLQSDKLFTINAPDIAFQSLPIFKSSVRTDETHNIIIIDQNGVIKRTDQSVDDILYNIKSNIDQTNLLLSQLNIHFTHDISLNVIDIIQNTSDIANLKNEVFLFKQNTKVRTIIFVITIAILFILFVIVLYMLLNSRNKIFKLYDNIEILKKAMIVLNT
jgi:hypothetical protein